MDLNFLGSKAATANCGSDNGWCYFNKQISMLSAFDGWWWSWQWWWLHNKRVGWNLIGLNKQSYILIWCSVEFQRVFMINFIYITDFYRQKREVSSRFILLHVRRRRRRVWDCLWVAIELFINSREFYNNDNRDWRVSSASQLAVFDRF